MCSTMHVLFEWQQLNLYAETEVKLVLQRKPGICVNFWCVKYKIFQFYFKASWMIKQK